MSDDLVRVEPPDIARTELAPRAALVLPRLIVDAGPVAVEKFLEFFAARIANRRTRAAYGRAVGQFLAWCEARGLALAAVSPLHVAAYIRTHPGSAPTVKQHLAAIRMLGDWLVVSQVLPVNPAAAVRGPTHVVTTGATPVLSPAEARRLLEAIDTGTLAGRRDRALVSVMLYSVARVSAVIAMRRQDYFRQESQGWLRLHEKGGTRHDVPAHHRAAEALDDYLARAGRDEATADGPGALVASRPGDDQAAGGRGGSPALDLLPHVPGDGDHGVSVEWGDARTRAADRRARLPEDDEALRSDGGHDHRRRDRAHRDLGGGRTARRRSPRDVRSASRDGRAARGRVRHVGVRLARTLDEVVRLRLFPPGGWVLGSASMARRAHPGRCSLAAHQERPQIYFCTNLVSTLTVTRMPSPSPASSTSAQRSAETSDRRSPPMNSSPAITPSRRPRAAASWSDSTPRPRRRGRWHVASTAARSAALNGLARPRPRSADVRR